MEGMERTSLLQRIKQQINFSTLMQVNHVLIIFLHCLVVFTLCAAIVIPTWIVVSNQHIRIPSIHVFTLTLVDVTLSDIFGYVVIFEFIMYLWISMLQRLTDMLYYLFQNIEHFRFRNHIIQNHHLRNAIRNTATATHNYAHQNVSWTIN